MTGEPKEVNEFEQALEANLEAQEISVGAVIDGTIAAIHGDVALVDVGGKSEAVLDRSELDDLGTGDPVEVVVVSAGDEVRVSRRLAIERRLKEKLARAVELGAAVDGKVVGRRKGGFDITVAGVRGFCPVSQISEPRTDDLDQHLGQTYSFKVLEFEPDQRRLVVSRAALQREERQRQREATWSALAEGGEIEGTVRSLTDFGAFVDLGGVDGLVHVTEISHRHVRNPREALEVGQRVRVKVIELDAERQRISLSIKQLLPDPWEGLAERFAVGSRFSGTVVRKAEFGAFVELVPGVDGLIHVSQLRPGMELDDAELGVGEPIEGWVRELGIENQRIGLTLRQVPDRDPWELVDMHYQAGQVVEGVVENGAPFGVFVELEPGLSALIPVSELGLEREVDPRTAFEPGARVSAKVLSVDSGRRRMSLSLRAFKREEEREEYQRHMDSGAPERGSTATAFGQRLMEALGRKAE